MNIEHILYAFSSDVLSPKIDINNAMLLNLRKRPFDCCDNHLSEKRGGFKPVTVHYAMEQMREAQRLSEDYATAMHNWQTLIEKALEVDGA